MNANNSNKKSIAYLASEYPGISHTFIFREILTLRELGFEVKTASIRKPENLDIMTFAEKADADATLYIKSTSLFKAVGYHLRLLLRSPTDYFAMVRAMVKYTLNGARIMVKGIGYLAEAGVLLDWMHKKNVDHIHVHFANPAATVAMIAAAYGTISYSLSVHGPDVFYNVTPNLLAEKIKKALFVRCISYFCQSQLKRLVSFQRWSKFQIVRCGINPDIFRPRPEPHNTIPEIVCVGRLVPAKGQHILLDAFGQLQKRGVKAHLTYVGDGEDRDSLEQAAQNMGISASVTFTGAVGQNDVHQYYDRADMFVLASFAEGVPVVLMEAMAKEIVAVSTSITGIPELIDNERDGILVPASDAEGLADRIEQLIKDPALRMELGFQGRQKVKKKYDLDRNCKEMAALFEKYLS
ncbi:glycosyltransferase family 4 protein [Desulfococcaceae bacterium HSG7]|nr:glycosyltransferase family 4 protein [Desulfococcaceae bacterium HSG7]